MPSAKKVIVAGGRDFHSTNPVDPRYDKRKADWRMLGEAMFRLYTDVHSEYLMPINMEVVSGAARGADTAGEDWAVVHWVPIKRFPAEWDKYGKSAGIKRNFAMAEYADELVAFWDGKSRGTENMIQTMLRLGKPTFVFFYE